MLPNTQVGESSKPDSLTNSKILESLDIKAAQIHHIRDQIALQPGRIPMHVSKINISAGITNKKQTIELRIIDEWLQKESKLPWV